MPHFERGATPPPPGPRDPILRVRANEHRTFLILSSTWWAITTHWDGSYRPKGRSFPCEAPAFCEYCSAEMSKRWKAYLHAIEEIGTKGREGFLELTPLAIETLESELGLKPELRGKRLQLHRGNADNAKLTVRALAEHGKVAPGRELMPEKSPEADLMRLWGFTKRKKVKIAS